MKILTQEEEAEHNKNVWVGGLIGGVGGLGLGALGVVGASRYSHAFRQLSVPFRAFLITSSTTFAAVINADRYSRAFEKSRHADSDYRNQAEEDRQQLEQQQSASARFKTFVSEQRYPIVFGSWGVSMAVALGIVGRSPYLTGQQKLVQARVYAQALTLAVLIASFALEGNDLRSGKGRWETVKVLDPNDPEHKRMIEKQVHHESYVGEDQWMDMVEAEEEKMKRKGHNVRSGQSKKNNQQGQNDQQDQQQQSEDSNNQKQQSGEASGQQQQQQQQQQSSENQGGEKAEAKSS